MLGGHPQLLQHHRPCVCRQSHSVLRLCISAGYCTSPPARLSAPFWAIVYGSKRSVFAVYVLTGASVSIKYDPYGRYGMLRTFKKPWLSFAREKNMRQRVRNYCLTRSQVTGGEGVRRHTLHGGNFEVSMRGTFKFCWVNLVRKETWQNI